MQSPNDEVAQPAIEEAGEAPKHELFAGDTGGLALDVRRVVVQLLIGPSVDAKRQTKLWPVLLVNERLVRSRLHELFLELVIDRDQQVAFTRQVNGDDLEVPILLRRAQLTFLDSALLLFLRQRLTHADAQGERAVVSIDEMVEHLTVYERHVNTDKSRFGRQMLSSIDKIKGHSLLQKIRASEDRFEVNPTLKLLFSAEEIQALTRTYSDLLKGDAVTQDIEPVSTESAGEEG